MRISAQLGMIVSVIFAIIAFSVATKGFLALGDIADPAVRSDSLGFAWFWAFLGIVAAVFAALNYWIIRTTRPEDS